MGGRPQVARDCRWHGVGDVDPYFHFVFEDFVFTGDGMDETRQRPTRAEGAVWYVGGGPRKEAVPLADVRQDGTYSSRHDTFSVGGHLIPKVTTGVDEPENLVPVSNMTNQLMRGVERVVQTRHHPHWLVVEVTEYYDEEDGDPRVPKNFRYSLYAGGTAPLPGAECVKRWANVPQAWLEVGPFNFSEHLIAHAAAVRAAWGFSGWKIEECRQAGRLQRDLSGLGDCLPRAAQRRPLAFLDYWMIVRNGEWLGEDMVDTYVNSIRKRSSFDIQWVRNVAIMGNVLVNNNWLISDVFGKTEAILDGGASGAVVESFRELIVGGGANAPHVDHIVPKSRGGPNCFSNAQITSMSYNAQKSNRTEALDVRSPQWRQDGLLRVAHEQMGWYR